MQKTCFYETLGVERSADGKTIKSAYRKLAMKYHPDRNPGDQESEKQFKEAKEAYEVLSNPHKRSAYDQFVADFDPQFGGFSKAPKFPPSMSLQILLRMHHRAGDPKALEIVEKTLDRMGRGGIYDHLGGGFHRYSTDNQWLVPHFEKMLYDNALLAWTYLEAYQVTGKRMYSDIVRGILDYVLSEMTNSQGGFYSAQDAGGIGEEGIFYVWSVSELKQYLTNEELAPFSSRRRTR